MNLFLDIATGQFHRSLNGAALAAVKFHAGDIVTLGITLVDGSTVVTAAQLADGKILRAAIRVFPLSSEPIATAMLSSVSGQVVSGTLDLSAQRVTDFFTANVPASSQSSAAILEVQIESADRTSIETISQARSLIARDLVSVGTVAAVLLADNDGTILADNDGTQFSDNTSV